MTAARPLKHHAASAANAARIVVGLIWLAGAAWNALVTIRMEDPYGWITEQTPLSVYRWFFEDVVGANPALWTMLLVAWEVAIGALTLAQGGWVRRGLLGGALFSAFLFSFASPFTLVMGPYALVLAWLARHEYHPSLFDIARSGFARFATGIGPAGAQRPRAEDVP